MVYAIYTLKDNLTFENIDPLTLRMALIRAFASNRVDFIRWAIKGTPDDDQIPELNNPKVSCIIRLELRDDNVQPMTAINDIQTKFAILLNEFEPMQIVVSSNQYNQQTIDFTFYPNLFNQDQ